jgi:hypothetical protein
MIYNMEDDYYSIFQRVWSDLSKDYQIVSIDKPIWKTPEGEGIKLQKHIITLENGNTIEFTGARYMPNNSTTYIFLLKLTVDDLPEWIRICHNERKSLITHKNR